MGRPSFALLRKRARAAKAADAVRVTEADRAVNDSLGELTLAAPPVLAANRVSTTRQNKLVARKGWKYVVANFHRLPLTHESGDHSQPCLDYGALRAMMKMRKKLPAGWRSDTKHGLKFLGTRSYDKKTI
jgi:hypothetical protein